MASGPNSPRRNKAGLALRASALALAMLLAAHLAGGVCRAAGNAAGKAGDNSPIVVTARGLFADNKKKLAVYRKNVVVKKGDITLYADEVTVRLLPGEKGQKPDGQPGSGIFKGGGKIDTIEARGGVKIVQQDRVATSDAAIYYSQTEKIVLTGSPRVWQGENVLTGSQITYDVKEDTFQVDEAKTVLYQEEKAKPAEGEAGKK